MDSQKSSACRAIVSGRVQMVMYRDFVQRKATHLALTGQVMNMKDGTVEVIAEGSRENLEQLVKKMSQGPLLARVDDVRVEWQEPTGSFQSFSISYT